MRDGTVEADEQEQGNSVGVHFVLHRYKLVKNVRSTFEMTDAQTVLNCDLYWFIQFGTSRIHIPPRVCESTGNVTK